MEFTLTVDLEKLNGDHAHELSRILRYWAGAFQQADLEPSRAMNVYDTRYQKVGRWMVADTNTLESEEADATDDLPESAAPAPAPELPDVPGQPDVA